MPKKRLKHKLTVQEYLGVPDSWPVVDKIKHSIYLMPNKEDIRKAVPRDPQACALHNAACRIHAIPNCAITATWAYIPQRDHKGKPYIARVRATPDTAKAIRRFDATGKMPEGGFEFVPYVGLDRLQAKRKYNKKHSKALRSGAREMGPKRTHTTAYRSRRQAPKFFVANAT